MPKVVAQRLPDETEWTSHQQCVIGPKMGTLKADTRYFPMLAKVAPVKRLAGNRLARVLRRVDVEACVPAHADKFNGLNCGEG